MRPVRVSVTGVGTSQVIVPDYLNAPFALGAAVQVSGSVTYRVQHTFDDVFDPAFNPATATWFNHPTLSGTGNVDSNYAFPVRGIRLENTLGTGTSTLTIVQAGNGL
jgi:hypothetical protein